jgi:hypothetical protein
VGSFREKTTLPASTMPVMWPAARPRSGIATSSDLHVSAEPRNPSSRACSRSTPCAMWKRSSPFRESDLEYDDMQPTARPRCPGRPRGPQNSSESGRKQRAAVARVVAYRHHVIERLALEFLNGFRARPEISMPSPFMTATASGRTWLGFVPALATCRLHGLRAGTSPRPSASTSGPITAANAAPWWIPKVAMASSKLLEDAVKESVVASA